MSPPPFSDLGKQARDILTKGYHLDYLKFEFKNAKGPKDVELASTCIHSLDQNKTTGTIELKKKLQEYGLTLLGKWNTNGVASTEVSNQDQILQGLKLSADTCYSFSEGSSKGSHVKGAYVNDRCALNGEIEIGKEESSFLTASAVVCSQGILAGLQTKFNIQSSDMDSYTIGGGYVTSDLVLNALYHNGEKMNISCYSKLMSELEGVVDLGYYFESGEPRIECGIKYSCDGSSAFRAKVDLTNVNLNRIGLGYQQKIAQGVTFFVSAQLNAGGTEENGHKFGLAVEFEA